MQKFKYKLKENSISRESYDYIGDYLRSLGVKKIESFVNRPLDEDEEDPRKLLNIEEMVDALHMGFIQNKKFYLQPDSDVDGYTSAAIFYSYFKELYPSAHID
jgi:single-stranded-DNA-specific exonuclease